MSAVAKVQHADLQSVSSPSPVAIRSSGEIAEAAILRGNLKDLTSQQRVQHYLNVCESLGLNPYTKPFDYIELDGPGKDADGNKERTLTLYAKRDAADQLRKLQGVSIKVISRETIDSIHVVTVQAFTPDGRTDEAIGVVPIGKEGGEWKKSERGKNYFEGDGTIVPFAPADMANALMKAETKAKRRVTLSICGLGFIDETEIETIRNARKVTVNHSSGEIIDTDSPPDDPAVILKRAMDALHALVGDRDLEHEDISALATSVYGVRSLTECTAQQLNGMRLTLRDCSNNQFADVMSLAGGIDGATDLPYLDSIGTEVENSDLPDMAKRLLKATIKRVGEGLQ